MASPDDHDLPDGEVDARFAELSRQLGPLQVPMNGPRDYAPVEDEEGFTEPDPDLGPSNPMVSLAWLALLTGLAALALTVLADLPSQIGVISALAAAAGLVGLLLQLPKQKTTDDGDGAQV